MDAAQSPTFPPRRSTRSHHPPAYLEDFHTTNTTVSTRYPINNYLSYHSLSASFKTTISSINSAHEPRSYNEASKSACWQSAMQPELQALTTNNTWILTPLPLEKETIGCKWVHKIKHNSDGTIDRHKAHLVAKGFTQLEGLDYLDTFSLVAKLTTLGLLLAVATTKNWPLKQLDVNNAFLHGDLHEEVYLAPPPGLPLLPDMSANFNALYMALSRLVANDDLVLTGDDTEEIDAITTALHQTFKIKNLGNLTYFLGLEVARNSTGLHLSQRKYTLDLLQETGMLDCAPMATPMTHTSRLSADQGIPLDNTAASEYRRLLGRLIYLTNTRPDITFLVHNLSQFISNPTTVHQQATSCILRYLKSTPGDSLFFPHQNNFTLCGFSDSDWASCPTTRKLVTSYSIFIGNSLISWKSKKQQTISRYSSEAEYRAMATTTCELQWIAYLLHDLHIPATQPANLYCDNQSAIQIASNQVFHERTKHIEIDCHLVREKLNTGFLKLLPITSAMQVADIFTKPLISS